MLELRGKYNIAKVYTDNVDSKTIGQIMDICNLDIFEGSSIRIMPDCHVGKGCTIGTTLTITDKIIPGLVGVDIGCGMTSIEVADLDLDKLDAIIRKYVPHGFNTHKTSREKDLLSYGLDLNKLKAPISNINRAYLSVGTLGGGECDCHRIG